MVATVDLTVRQTETWEQVFVFQDDDGTAIDFTGDTFEMVIGDAGSAPDETFTTAGGQLISTDLANGKITIKFAIDEISTAFVKSYDLFRVTGAEKRRIMTGAFTSEVGIEA